MKSRNISIAIRYTTSGLFFIMGTLLALIVITGNLDEIGGVFVSLSCMLCMVMAYVSYTAMRVDEIHELLLNRGK